MLFAVFQTGSGANGGVESITQILENLEGVDRIVVTQRETSVCDRWRAYSRVRMLAVPYQVGEALDWRSPLAVLGRIGSLIRNNAKICAIHRDTPLDVLHANDTDALLHTGFGAILCGVPVLLNVRDIHEPEHEYGLKWWLARVMSRRLVALSGEMVTQLRARLPRADRDGSDIEHVYSIVDATRMHPLDPEARAARRRALGIADGEFAIGYVANIFSKKNQLGFLQESVGRILREIPAARVHFLGDFDVEGNPYARQCLEAARALDPAGTRIVFHGYTPEVSAWYPALDLVALASRREGLARCMIEALACATPVVSFAVCSAREILETHGCGRVVPLGDFDALARETVALARDPEWRATLGRRGAEMAARNFGPAAAIEAYRQIYGELAETLPVRRGSTSDALAPTGSADPSTEFPRVAVFGQNRHCFASSAGHSAAVIRPNVVFVGAPKCGTSSAFSWLTAHPDCFGSTPKEPFFLLDPGHPLTGEKNIHTHGLEAYGECFPGYAGQRILCEASTHYLYQDTALEVLAGLEPKPKIIILLRRPELRILSSFLYTRNNLTRLDRHVTFEEYTRLLLAGRTGELSAQFTEEASRYVLARDLEYSEYAKYVERWIAKFGAENVNVEIFKAFVGDPRAAMARIAKFVGIDPAFYDDFDFSQKNATNSIPMQALHRFALWARPFLPAALIKNRLLRSNYFGLQALVGKNMDKEKVEPSLQALARHFEEPNRRLSRLLDRDLSLWHTPW